MSRLLLATFLTLAFPRAMAFAAAPEGVWLMEGRATVQIFNCGSLLCGQILRLQTPRDPEGKLNRDANNPDPALRQRRLCGLTVMWGLRPSGGDSWSGGSFYNPEDGKTYSVSARLQTADQIVARIYLGIPLLGETKTLRRVQPSISEGWC
jgi:uncharacterized protein (DUF2147 family)